MGDFITFSLILCNKYISLDNKKKSLKILLFSITLQRKANLYQLFFACLQEKKYIYIYLILTSQIIALAWTEASGNILLEELFCGIKIFMTTSIKHSWDTQSRRSLK